MHWITHLVSTLACYRESDAVFLIAWLSSPHLQWIPLDLKWYDHLLSSYLLTSIVRAVHNAGGAGSLFHEPATADNVGWSFMFGITAILGAWGAGTLGQSDWTRYANRKFAPTLSQLVAAPITISVTAIIGIIVTSASHDILGGELVWNPIYLLADIQEEYNSSSRSRAAVFFASMGMVSSQLAVSWTLHLVFRTSSTIDPSSIHHRLIIDLAFLSFPLTLTDLGCSELRIHWNGHGWSLPEIHQHCSRKLHHGCYWNCCSTMAIVEHCRQIPLGFERIRCLHGSCNVSHCISSFGRTGNEFDVDVDVDVHVDVD
jgi:hypothetical protein